VSDHSGSSPRAAQPPWPELMSHFPVSGKLPHLSKESDANGVYDSVGCGTARRAAEIWSAIRGFGRVQRSTPRDQFS